MDEHDHLVAPVELIGFAGRKTERHESRRRPLALAHGPRPAIAPDSIVAARIPDEAPVGSNAALDDAMKVRPRFTPDQAGDYTIELIVRAGSKAGVPVQFIASTVNQAPSAKIVVSPHLASGVTTLDARRSVDTDGDALTYAWTLTTKPRGSVAVIANAASPLAQVTADLPGAYTVALSVTDARGKTTLAAPVIFLQTQTLLTANAGPDRRGVLGSVVWLDPFLSTDASLAAGQLLSASWSLLSVPAASKALPGTELLGRTPFTPDVAGDYVAQLAVTDGTTTAYDSVVVSIGASASVPPVANVGT